ncbi:MAG: hypothetical protein WD690_11390 [Vicinamibacterales bacterium]
MTSLRLVRVAAIPLLVFSFALPATARQAQVTAMVTVVSDSGAPAADLTAADFVVKE